MAADITTLLGSFNQLISLMKKQTNPTHIQTINNTALNTNLNGYAISVLVEAEIVAITFTEGTNVTGDTLAGVSLPVGVHFLPVDQLTLASGTVQIFKTS